MTGATYTPAEAHEAFWRHIECLARHSLDGVRRCKTPEQAIQQAVQAGLLAALLMSVSGIQRGIRS